MAPRKKQKLMRIDAALDAMRPMGFPDSLVRKTVRDLLKEYGGNECWPFIEEFSYKVLTDELLKITSAEGGGGGGGGEEERDDRDEEERPHEEQLVEHNDEAGGLVLNEDAKGESEKVDQQLELYAQGVDDEDVCQEDEVDNESHLSPKDKRLSTGFGGDVHPTSSCTPPLVDCAPAIRRCQPSYGWISDDD